MSSSANHSCLTPKCLLNRAEFMLYMKLPPSPFEKNMLVIAAHFRGNTGALIN